MMPYLNGRCYSAQLLLLGNSAALRAEDPNGPAPAGQVSYHAQVRPILPAHCQG